jgi:GntR family transcriptional regulator, transcriptional repressor for pyruvate dehydrogenase complex
VVIVVAPGRIVVNSYDDVLFKPIKTKRAFEEISVEIKKLIFSGSLKPGDRLPSETKMASQFGVNRHTIREAIRRLEGAGFIAMQRGGPGGPLIVNTILDTISGSFLDAFQMEQAETGQLIKARIEIESMVLKNVFGAIDEQDLERLRENVEQSRNLVAAGEETFEEHTSFHKLLAKATKNFVFVIIMEALMTALAQFHSFSRVSARTSKKADEAHGYILGLIEKGDEKAALKMLERHILEVAETYERSTPDLNTASAKKRNPIRVGTK